MRLLTYNQQMALLAAADYRERSSSSLKMRGKSGSAHSLTNVFSLKDALTASSAIKINAIVTDRTNLLFLNDLTLS